MSNQIEGFIKGIFLGGLIGAAIGILFAPKSGRETREEINRKADELITKVKKEYEATLKKSENAYEAAVKQLKSLESSSKEKAGEMGKKVDELTELGKEAFHDTKSQLTKVVNDAVHAFK